MEGQTIIILLSSIIRQGHEHACVYYYSAVCSTRCCGLLMRSRRNRRRPSIVFWGINGIPIKKKRRKKRCAIWNMRQISSKEITRIKMDEIEQKGWKESEETDWATSDKSHVNICWCLIKLIHGPARYLHCVAFIYQRKGLCWVCIGFYCLFFF